MRAEIACGRTSGLVFFFFFVTLSYSDHLIFLCASSQKMYSRYVLVSIRSHQCLAAKSRFVTS